MTSGNEIATALYARLAGDATLLALIGSSAIYYIEAPASAPVPFVTFNEYGGAGDAYVLSGPAYQDVAWIVKAVTGPGGAYSPAAKGGSILARCHALLQDYLLAPSGGTASLLRRVNRIAPYPENEQGQVFMHQGAVYRLMVV